MLHPAREEPDDGGVGCGRGKELPSLGIKLQARGGRRGQRRAATTSRPICSRRASGEGHCRSSRRRARKVSRRGVSAFSATGRKSSRWLSMAKDASAKVGRLPTLVTESKQILS